eukprot:14593574-Alexandrium_andersonii.AAC.1
MAANSVSIPFDGLETGPNATAAMRGVFRIEKCKNRNGEAINVCCVWACLVHKLGSSADRPENATICLRFVSGFPGASM